MLNRHTQTFHCRLCNRSGPALWFIDSWVWDLNVTFCLVLDQEVIIFGQNGCCCLSVPADRLLWYWVVNWQEPYLNPPIVSLWSHKNHYSYQAGNISAAQIDILTIRNIFFSNQLLGLLQVGLRIVLVLTILVLLINSESYYFWLLISVLLEYEIVVNQDLHNQKWACL